MDRGANMKTESQLINRSLGKTKHKDVKFFNINSYDKINFNNNHLIDYL